MATPKNSKQTNNPTSNTADKTFDPRDLVSKGGYQKNPREIIENPAVTPQMPEESSDSQVGMESSDREDDNAS